jgi:hypothetical protein
MRRARPGDWAFLDTVVSVCYDARGQEVTTLPSRGIMPLPPRRGGWHVSPNKTAQKPVGAFLPSFPRLLRGRAGDHYIYQVNGTNQCR